ncbi:MAG TPA: biotin/lipoyl-containing protein, partial [Methyloceanibacter sp.]
MPTEIRVPNLGESIVEATVGQWFKQAGDTVSAAEPLVELETDKVTVEVPAPASGVLAEIAVKTGETVPVGALLGAISEGDGKAKPTKAKPEAATLSLAAAEASAIAEEPALRAAAPTEPKTLEREPQRREEVSAEEMPPSPAARKLIAEAGLGAHDVKGSGRRGQVLKPDVLANRPAAPVTSIEGAAEALLRREPKPKPSAPPRAPLAPDDASREERVRMTRLRLTIAKRLKEA